MDINPNTGKGWTDTEEASFAEVKVLSGTNCGEHSMVVIRDLR